MHKKILSKEYSEFALKFVGFVLVLSGIFSYFSLSRAVVGNSKILKSELKNIEVIISESFDYTNQINSQLGRQIAEHGAKDFGYILNLLHETEKTTHRNLDLFSWSSFDWVNDKSQQIINSKLGFRKSSPDMSKRHYTALSRAKPWTLQVSSPDFGNPSNSWVVPAGTGVVDKNGKYLGIIAVGFDIVEFANKISQKINQGVSFVVLDNELNVVFKSTELSLENDSKFFKENFDQKIFDAEDGVIKKEIKVDDINFTHHKKFSKYPYIALVGFNKSFLDKQFFELILPQIFELIILTIFFLFILFIFKTRIVVLLEKEQKLKSSLEKANQAKDRIFSSISHDVKNYIYGIHGLAILILQNKSKSEISNNEDLQMIEKIADQAEELMEFVKDLLDSEQLETGEFNLGKLKKCNVKTLIENVILLSNLMAKNNQTKIKLEIANDIPAFTCDPRRVKQILINLISNAIKYNKVGGEVTILAKHLVENNQLYFEIIDQGFGMNDQEIEKYLSQRGEEIDKSEIAKVKSIDSYGIGMKIVLRLVSLHHGKVSVESQKGVGTKVKLYFDLNGFDSSNVEKNLFEDKKIAEKPEIPNNLNDEGSLLKHILLVDDNPVNIKITTRLLEQKNYKVLHAENGEEAIKILDQKDFDLVFMDGEMPVMNGFEATKIIREGSVFKNFKNYKSIPIIALMSSNDEETLDRVKESGMNDHVEKSTSKTKLFEAIEKWCKLN